MNAGIKGRQIRTNRLAEAEKSGDGKVRDESGCPIVVIVKVFCTWSRDFKGVKRKVR